ncbi:hypothetical protein EV648_103103 [Kribbella sp. VKM Ac-2568]|nr:hypothetical protein EV648_103103 [Kribbella sp. VKM Ac-2568]
MHWDESSNQRVPPPIGRPTAVKAELGDADVRSWELGLRAGEQAPEDDADGLPGFGLDRGLGCLLDASDLGFLRRLQRDDLERLDSILDAVGPDGAEIITDPEMVGGLLIDLELLSHGLGTAV